MGDFAADLQEAIATDWFRRSKGVSMDDCRKLAGILVEAAKRRVCDSGSRPTGEDREAG